MHRHHVVSKLAAVLLLAPMAWAGESQPYVELVPIQPYNGAAYPDGVMIDGNTVTVSGVSTRLWFELRIGDLEPVWTGGWYARIDLAGYTNGIGADLVRPGIPCVSEADCLEDVGAGSQCYGYCQDGFVDTPRDDALYPLGIIEFPPVFPDFGSFLLNGFPFGWRASWYGGTFVVDVPADAVGDYVIGFDQAASYIMEPGGVYLDVDYRPAIVHIPAGRCCSSNVFKGCGIMSEAACLADPSHTNWAEGATCGSDPCPGLRRAIRAIR